LGGITVSRRWSRAVAIVTVVLLVTAVAPAFTSPADAQEPSHVQFTFEGCRGSFGGSFPITGPFVCADTEYTTGNLGKGWNELDLVPHRVTLSLGTQTAATTTYDFNIVADNEEAGAPGYDRISEPVVNDSKSHASCTIDTVGAQQDKVPGIGGTDVSIYRTITVSQNKGTTCVLDWHQRLAFGSHLYPGASLHSNLTQQDFSVGGIGARDVSIPVSEIQPPEFSKNMQAVQGASHDWVLTKDATPVILSFSNTCDDGTGALQDTVEITVAWTRLAADPSGPVTITTVLTVVNNAHRPLLVDLEDVSYDGDTVINTFNLNDIVVTPGSHPFVHSFSYTPSGTPSLRDEATADFRDPLEPTIVVGTLTATDTATVESSGANDNETAVITDTESITGDGLSFSVAAPSVGSFVGYTAGDETTGPVDWTSGTVSESGSVTFTKTVHVDQPRETSGTLSDTATLTGSEGLTRTASAETDIDTSVLVELTIVKNIPDVLTGSESKTFDFEVRDSSDALVDEVSITFTAGETQDSVTLTGLDPDEYTITEDETTSDPFTPAVNPLVVDLSLNTDGTAQACSGEAEFTNNLAPANAEAVKITDPAGNEEGWEFCLNGPGITEECKTTDSAGEISFDTLLVEEGEYTITETVLPGFDQTDADGCTFTVNFPADSGRTFTCTITNTQRGMVEVLKTTDGAVDPTLDFTFRLTGPGLPPGGITDSTLGDDDGILDFGGAELIPGETYTICEENIPAGWTTEWTLGGNPVTPYNPDSPEDLGNRCVDFSVDPGETLRITVNNVSPPGGDARTPGYWKNWNTCTKGNQAQTAANNGGAAEGFFLLEDVLPISLGDLVIDNCQDGVDILNRTDLNGTKRANDAAYYLASHLLAAKANIEAGASTCPAANQAIADGDALLVSIGFDGTGAFLPPKTSNKVARALAIAIAGTLDSYNNNELC